MTLKRVRPLAVLLAVLAAILGLGGGQEAAATVADHFQKIRVKTPDKPVGFAFIISDADGWQPAQQALADALYARDWTTVGVDLALYRSGLKADSDCHHIANELIALAKALQRERRMAQYLVPAIVGFGEGGAMAYDALAQSMPQSFSRVISVAPAAALDTPLALCGLAATRTPRGYAYAAVPTARLTAPYAALSAAEATPDRLAAQVAAADSPPADRAALARLPIVPLAVANPGDVMVVFIAGDGGWRDLDKTVGERLQAMGIPVVGLDTLKYFWAEQTPEQLAQDLGKVISHYSAAWRRPQVVLAGYSFGADVLPAAYNRLPRAQRRKVTALSLLAASKTANFEIYVGGWVGLQNDDGTPILPEISKIPAAKIQCIYGEEDAADSLCPLLTGSGATIIRTTGGHHFDHDYATLANRVAKAPDGH